jgi:predicted transcriptional regulator
MGRVIWKEHDMDTINVRDLMIPVDKFPKISHSAKFFEAISALETAQENYLSGKAEQRILLVTDDQGKVIGKISPIDVFRGLETNYAKVDAEATVKRFGFKYIWESMQKDYQLWESPFKDLCRRAGDIQIKDFNEALPDGQAVSAEDTLDKCFHLFVMHRHDSLFVLKDNNIIGLLRFSDVYRKVSETIKSCAL